jgi:hypothetical protein
LCGCCFHGEVDNYREAEYDVPINTRSRDMPNTTILNELRSSPRKGPKRAAPQADFLVTGGGSVYLLHPLSDAAREWVGGHIPDDAQWLGRAVAVEHRYIEAIVDGIVGDGLSVGGVVAA